MILNANSFSVKEAAQEAGVSPRVVRKHCKEGTCPGVKYYEFPGTATGFYTLSKKSIEWLQANIRTRNRPTKDELAAKKESD